MQRILGLKPLLLLTFLVSVISIHAETPPTASDTTTHTRRLSLYLDGYTTYTDYIQTALPWFGFVRDRHDADVHALLTHESTGAFGVEWTWRLLGLGRLEGMSDTLKWKTLPTSTEESIRVEIVRMLQIGLVRYLTRAGLADNLDVSYHAESGIEPPKEDRWKGWAFSMDLMGYFDGEKAYSNNGYMYIVSANHTTDWWRLNGTAASSVTYSRYELDDGVYKSDSKNYVYTFYAIKSLGEHWGVGLYNRERQSTFRNTDLMIYNNLAAEYNLYPYSQSTSRQLRLQYGLNLTYYDYTEETIYEKLKETVTKEFASIILDYVEPWGSASASLAFSHFFRDFDMQRLTFSSNLSLRLAEGLSLGLFGNASVIHDQIALRRGGASDEDILLERRELETSFNYSGQVGLSYTFGSIYSSAVNARMDEW